MAALFCPKSLSIIEAPQDNETDVIDLTLSDTDNE